MWGLARHWWGGTAPAGCRGSPGYGSPDGEWRVATGGHRHRIRLTVLSSHAMPQAGSCAGSGGTSGVESL